MEERSAQPGRRRSRIADNCSLSYCAAQCKWHNGSRPALSTTAGGSRIFGYRWKASIESHGQMDRPGQLRCRNRQRPRRCRGRIARRRRAEHRAAADGARAGGHRSMHGIRRRLDPEKGAPADQRLHRRCRGRTRADRSQGVHAHALRLSDSRRRLEPGAGRARGQAVEGKILLGDADAGQDCRDQLRDQHQRRAA